MRSLATILGVLSCILFASGHLRAQSRYPITVSDVRFGLPPGKFATERDENGQTTPLFKAGAWAPIQISLDCDLSAEWAEQEIEIIVGTPDNDDVVSEARSRMRLPAAGRHEGLHPPQHLFLKPGGIASEISVRIAAASNGQPLAETFTKRLNGLPSSRFLVLSCGRPLNGLRLPRSEAQAGEASADNESLRNGWVQHAQLTRPEDCPDRWFGYDAVDLLILNDADADFWADLKRHPGRCEAIAEWVRRGGRILIAGQATLFVEEIPQLRELLPLAVDRQKAGSVSEVPLVLPNSPRLLLRGSAGNTIPIVSIKPVPDRFYQVKLSADEHDSPYPLVVQAPYGLGRVTVVSFDLDRRPFEDWNFREIFWEWLINTCGTRLPSGSESSEARGDDEDRYLAHMQNNLEFFEGVPVVSFGWVALLILTYILLIGPLEALVLKKLLKRAELTWITFPIIVASVCAGAYFATVELKGHEMKTNKIDLLEVDLRGERAYGQTWFTLFSPRIQNYDIGVEPIVVPGEERDILMSWSGKAKIARQNLLRRSYSYHSSADGAVFADRLDRVPIQVWSTKSFTARWSARMKQPLFESTLHLAAADPTQLTGSITSRWPGAVIVDAQLFYRDRVTPVPPLLKDIPRYLSTSAQAASPTSWLHNHIVPKDLIPTNRSNKSTQGDFDAGPQFRMWPLLFHDAVQGQFGRLYNASVRELDQSWRIGDKSPREAILVARLSCREGPAETMSEAPGAVSRLRLGSATKNSDNHPLEGTLRQETYIRVYIPIAASGPTDDR